MEVPGAAAASGFEKDKQINKIILNILKLLHYIAFIVKIIRV